MTKNQLVTAFVPIGGSIPDGPRVLIVDDDKEIRDSLHYALSSYDMEVTLCENATEALLAVMIESFDFIVIDFRMPGMNGIELVRRLRTMLPPRVVIIGMSSVDLGMLYLAAGANDFLEKPVVPYTLAMMIDGGDILA